MGQTDSKDRKPNNNGVLFGFDRNNNNKYNKLSFHVLSRLHQDELRHILLFIDVDDWLRIQRVNRWFYEIVNDALLWETAYDMYGVVKAGSDSSTTADSASSSSSSPSSASAPLSKEALKKRVLAHVLSDSYVVNKIANLLQRQRIFQCQQQQQQQRQQANEESADPSTLASASSSVASEDSGAATIASATRHIRILCHERDSLACTLYRDNNNNNTLKGAESRWKRKSKKAQPVITIKNAHLGKIYAVNSNSSLLITVGQDGKCIIWDVCTKKPLQKIVLATWSTMACQVSPDGSLIAYGGLDNRCSVHRRNASSSSSSSSGGGGGGHHDGLFEKRPCTTFSANGYVPGVEFLDNNRVVFCSGDSSCRLGDLQTGNVVAIFYGHSQDVMSVSKEPNNCNLFLSASCDLTSRLWDARLAPASACVGTFVGHSLDVNCARFFSGGTLFTSCSDDTTCMVFDTRLCGNNVSDARARALLKTFTDSYSRPSVCSSPSGAYVIGSNDCGTVSAGDVLSGDSFTVLEAENRVSSLCICGGGTSGAPLMLTAGSWDYSLRFYPATFSSSSSRCC